MEYKSRKLMEKLKHAIAGLVKTGKPAVSALIKALKDEDWVEGWIAAQELWRRGDPSAVPALVEILKHESDEVRLRAAGTLAEIFRKCKTIEALDIYEKGLDEGLARLQKKYRDDDLVEIGFAIAKMKKMIAAKKNELASQRDLILEDIPKPPPKKKGRMRTR